jgi:hypothetical protein
MTPANLTSEQLAVIEKAAKILALARDTGATEHEAQTALVMAQNLLSRAGLDTDDVDAVTGTRRVLTAHAIEERTVFTSIKSVAWAARLAGVIAKNFRCVCMISKTTEFRGYSDEGKARYRQSGKAIRLMGRAPDVTLAAEVYSAALAALGHLWTAYAAAALQRGDRAQSRDVRYSFIRGFTTGLESMYQQHVASTALVVVPDDEVRNEYDALTGGRNASKSSARASSHAAYRAGYEQGAAYGGNKRLD